MSAMPELPGVSHHFIDASGLRTHFATAGAEDAPPVLLVHGWPQNWWAWRHVITDLATDFRVIAPDLRGHGWTDSPPEGYEKEQLASDLIALLDALGVESATWVGHDWGAWTGFLAALRAPERIERMLALCIPHPWTPPHPRQLAMLAYQGPISLPYLGRRLADPVIRRVIQAGRGGKPLAQADVELFTAQIPPHVTVSMYRTFLTREVAPVARGRYADALLEVPTQLLVGARDLVTMGVRRGLVPGQPQLRIGLLDGVAHWVPEQRPQAVIDWVRER